MAMVLLSYRAAAEAVKGQSTVFAYQAVDVIPSATASQLSIQ